MKKATLIIIIVFLLYQYKSFAQWHVVSFEVGIPAEVFLGNYNKIAVGDFVDANGRNTQHATDAGDEMTNQLFELENFEVLDRDNLQQILTEQNLGQTDIINENTAAELGEVIGSGVLVTGRIQADKFNTQINSKEVALVVNGCNIKKWREAKYSLNINLKILDVETSEVLLSKTLKAVDARETDKIYCCSYGGCGIPAFDENGMYKRCLGKISNDFKGLLAPYVTKTDIAFLKHSAYNDELRQALTFVQLEEYEEGIRLLRDITTIGKVAKKPKVQAQAFANLGLVQVYDKQYEEAKESLREAFILDSKETTYSNLIKLIDEQKEMDEEFARQMEILGE